MANATNEAAMPHMVDIDVFGTPTTNPNGYTPAIVNTEIFNARFQTPTPAINDEFSWDVLLKKGTWSIEFLYTKFNSGGIIHVEIDDVEVGTLDTYAASPSSNNLSSITGVSVDGSGIHNFKVVTASKNASSGGYSVIICGIRLIRTGD